MKVVRIRFLLGLFAVAVFVQMLGGSAMATHNRATQLAWNRGAGAHEVEFTIDFVARRSYYGEPNVGEAIYDPYLSFGDGAEETPPMTILAIDGDIIYTQAHVTHVYPDDGPYTATMGSCCRLSPGSGHINNGDLFYSVHTLVDLERAVASPHIAVAPIVYCATSGLCSFAFSGTGASPGNHLRWRLATPVEAGDTLFVQPGPPYAPNSVSVDPVLGRMSWDTTGASLSEPGLPTYYSTQVVAEEIDAEGNTVSESAADFFIGLDDNHSQQPDCDDVNEDGSVDSDADGLCDNWEITGIDSDDNGSIDFELPSSASPVIPDIFVEADYMEGQQPQSSALEAVKKAFEQHGFHLHFSLGDEVPFTEDLAFDPGCSPCGSGTSDFDTVKADYFGTIGDRSVTNSAARLAAKRYVYHYALFANQLQDSHGTSGVAELPGNDLVVTMGDSSWRTGADHDGPPTIRNEAGTFMHELGHNLGLYHGGGDTLNCKPNYVSVMNYTRQTTGVVPSPGLSYSESALPPLDENNLDEFQGVQGAGGVLVAHGPGSFRLSSASGPIDWDRQNGLESDVSADVSSMSDVPGCEANSPGDLLTGHNDWGNLALPFQATADFADGVHASILLQDPDVVAEDVVGIDSDGDGIPNIQDECPTQAGSVPESGCPASSPPPAQSDPIQAARAPAAAGSPPGTKLLGAKIKPARGKALFRFSSIGSFSSFQCSLDRKPFKACKSPVRYRNLKPGRHLFQVRAVDGGGLVDPTPVVKRFWIR